MNGTSGMRPKMAHASFQPRGMSGRVARSSHIKTTARGWRKQTRSSKSFFIALNLPRPMRAAGLPRSLTSAHQRESFCVKLLAGASSVVCPCIAVMGWSRQRVIGLVRRRAGLPMMCAEITVCLNAAEGSPRPPACSARCG